MTAVLFGLATTAYLAIATLCIRLSLSELTARGRTERWRLAAATLAGALWPLSLTIIFVWATLAARTAPAARTPVSELFVRTGSRN